MYNIYNRYNSKKRLKLFILFELALFVLFSSINGFGQVKKWTLSECLSYALEHNIDLQQMNNNVTLAEVNLKQAKSQRYPNLNFGINSSLNFGRTVDPTTNVFRSTNFLSNGYNLNSSVTLYNGGRINNTIKSQQSQQEAFMADKESTMINLAFNIADAYFSAILASENIKVLNAQIQSIDQELERMQKLIRGGVRPQADIYDLEAQKATILQNHASAENNYDLALVNLKTQMNISFDTQMELTIPNTESTFHSDVDNLTFEEAFVKARNFSPSLRALIHRLKSSEYELLISKANLYPVISLGGNVSTNYSNQAQRSIGSQSIEQNSPVRIDGEPAIITTDAVLPIFGKTPYFNQITDNVFYGVGVNVNVPLYNNYNTNAQIERAKIDVENAKLQLDVNDNNLRSTIQRLLTDARGAKRTLEASEKTLIAREKAFENAQKRVDVGALNFYDFVNIQNAMNQAQLNLLIARYDFFYKVKVLDYYQGYPVSF